MCACRRNTQLVYRFVTDYALSDECRARPRFIIVCDPGQSGGQDKTEDEALLFVTFDASLLRHHGADAAGGPLLQVAGHERPFAYEELIQRLGLLERHKHLDGAAAFSKKVLELLFRDINDGGTSSNWELMSYVYVDPKGQFEWTFEDDDPALVPVFMDTFATTVQFLRDSLKGAESYEEISLIDAFRSATAANLPSLSVEHLEEDVTGTRGECFKQFYHCGAQHLYDGKGGANGEGSFRYLLTTATVGGTPTLNSLPGSSSGSSSMEIDSLRSSVADLYGLPRV